MGILKFLGLQPDRLAEADSRAETVTVRKIVDTLDHLDPERARFIAAFAYVLSRVAHAEGGINRQETRAMEQIVMERGGLPEEQAIIVVQMAKSQSLLFGCTENYVVTREFNKIASREEKMALLNCLFAVSSADDSVSSVEETEIRQIADELKLDHQDFIAARLAHKEHLAVLKDPSPGGP